MQLSAPSTPRPTLPPMGGQFLDCCPPRWLIGSGPWPYPTKWNYNGRQLVPAGGQPTRPGGALVYVHSDGSTPTGMRPSDSGTATRHYQRWSEWYAAGGAVPNVPERTSAYPPPGGLTTGHGYEPPPPPSTPTSGKGAAPVDTDVQIICNKALKTIKDAAGGTQQFAQKPVNGQCEWVLVGYQPPPDPEAPPPVGRPDDYGQGPGPICSRETRREADRFGGHKVYKHQLIGGECQWVQVGYEEPIPSSPPTPPPTYYDPPPDRQPDPAPDPAPAPAPEPAPSDAGVPDLVKRYWMPAAAAAAFLLLRS